MTEKIPLYRRVLGSRFDVLPPEIRTMHEVTDYREARGRCHIDRGRHPLARLVAWLFRFPPAGADVPVSVRFTVNKGRETWRRDFAGAILVSIQEAPAGIAPGMLVERFGPFAFALAVPAGPTGLSLEPRQMWFCGVPMPNAMLPRIEAGETVVDGRFRFDVRLAMPWIGLLVHYRGHLIPVDDTVTGCLGKFS